MNNGTKVYKFAIQKLVLIQRLALTFTSPYQTIMHLFSDNEPITSAACTTHLRAVGDALYVIGGKWKLRVIVALSGGHTRFNDIQRAIEGISARVLSNELKDLEINGFVNRTVQNTTPVIIEYMLTEYSKTLEDIMRALSTWGTMHRERLRQEINTSQELVN